MYQNFIGIDIAKSTFVAAGYAQGTTQEFKNSPEGFLTFYKQYQSILPSSLVILETTGGYEMDLITFLTKQNIAVHRTDGRKAKYFIRSLGKTAKSDKIDAQGLARYGYERHQYLELFAIKTFEQTRLQQLTQRRLDLKAMLVQEKNRSQAAHQDAWVKRCCAKMIATLEKQIKELEKILETLIAKEPELKAKQQILKKVDGIGTTLATGLLGLLPELGTVNRRRIASLCGVAPHPNESGQRNGYRCTKGGRKEVRSMLFMGAMTASRSKGRLGDFYRHLIAQGKRKMVALTALMRKIIVIANAKLLEWNHQQIRLSQHS